MTRTNHEKYIYPILKAFIDQADGKRNRRSTDRKPPYEWETGQVLMVQVVWSEVVLSDDGYITV